MSKTFFDRYLEQRVFIKLKSGRFYTGVLKEVADTGNGLMFISFIDRFGEWVTVSSNELEAIEPEREELVDRRRKELEAEK